MRNTNGVGLFSVNISFGKALSELLLGCESAFISKYKPTENGFVKESVRLDKSVPCLMVLTEDGKESVWTPTQHDMLVAKWWTFGIE
ncbi:hypothetical protein ACHJH3_06690 [Campylobacter sp. MOP7]|uniref:hypothetical protein n=1 Tax=Campylobacter canis TaxID=3378588 RepID=UPI00387E3E5F